MKISLVICTRNRASQLAQSLQRIRALRCAHPWELIVVDNGSTDDTSATIDRYRQSHPTDFKVIVEPLAGLGRARNRGWMAARGEIVAFTDDDCYSDDQLLQQFIKCFDEDGSLGFIGGRILLHDPTDYRISVQESERREDLPPKSFIPAGLVQGANFALRRAALEAVGGFDEAFGVGAIFPCEDIDVVARMSDAGWWGAYDPRPVIYHHHRRKTPTEVSHLKKQYDRGRGAYYAKCVLNPSQRALYLKNWRWKIREQSRGATVREFRAALEYLVRVHIPASVSKSRPRSHKAG
jgi:glycosyltransferase involved in cell wall biosynthesis